MAEKFWCKHTNGKGLHDSYSKISSHVSKYGNFEKLVREMEVTGKVWEAGMYVSMRYVIS